MKRDHQLAAGTAAPPCSDGIADYRCNKCGKIVKRQLGWKAWTPSFCESLGRDARLYRVSVPVMPNKVLSVSGERKETDDNT